MNKHRSACLGVWGHTELMQYSSIFLCAEAREGEGKWKVIIYLAADLCVLHFMYV